MTPLFWYVLLGFVIFVQLIVYWVTRILGGATFWEYIKSKLPWSKVSGAWFLKCNRDNRLTFEWKKVPKNKRIKITSGKTKAEDIYADITKVRMYKDEDGCPVYILTEDLPFSLFIKKYAFDNYLERINAIKSAIAEVRKPKDKDVKREFVSSVKQFINDIRLETIYLKEAQDILNVIDLKIYEENLDYDTLINSINELEDIISMRNYSFVNINDIFKSSEYVDQDNKNNINMFYTGYYEGQRSNKLNIMDIILIVLVAVSMILSGYAIYKIGKVQDSINAMLPKIDASSKALDLLPKDINGHVIVVPSTDIKTNINPANTNITGG